MPTMKEQRASASRVNPEYCKALTPEQQAKPSCRWFHKWDRVDDPIKAMNYAYFQCRKCYDRKAVSLYRGGGYTAVGNSYWLEGKEWGYIPLAPKAPSGLSRAKAPGIVVPPPPTPESVQVTLHEGTAPHG